jgi:hypothetical protein
MWGSRATNVWAAMAMISMAAPAEANFYTGNELLKACQSSATTGRCYGYLQTVHDAGLATAAALNGQNKAVGFAWMSGFRWCIPEGVDSTQVHDVVVKYLRDNPKDRQLAAVTQVAAAYEKGWPCKE